MAHAQAEPLGVRVALQCALAVASVLLFFTYLDSYLFALGGPKPWEWVLAFSVGAAAVLVADPRRPLVTVHSPLLLFVLFYFAMTAAWAPFLMGPDAVQQVYDRCRSIVSIIAFALLFEDARARRWAIRTVAACVVLISALNAAEFLSLLTFTAGPERIPGRASGFFFNPNESALAITLGAALVAEEIPRRWRTPLLIVSLLGVAPTFSRGALVCLGLVFLWLAWRKALAFWPVMVGSVLGAVLLKYAVDFSAAHDLLTDNTASRLRLMHDDSGRLELARMAWQMFASSPWVGHGIGSTSSWGAGAYPHNMLFMLGAEQGILGLLTFPAFGVALFRSNRSALGFVLVLMVAGLISHGLLTTRYALLLAALAAATPVPVTAPEGYVSPFQGDEASRSGAA